MVLNQSMKVFFSFLLLVASLTIVDSTLFNGDRMMSGLKKVAKAVDPRQVVCLAENIFHEAGGEVLLGQAAVARVVVNRINHGFGKTPCAVVQQETVITATDTNESTRVCQFSWWCDENKVAPERNDPSYKQAKAVAYQVLAYDAYSEVVPSNTLYFHNTSTDPKWPHQRVGQIGNHVFYNKKKMNRER